MAEKNIKSDNSKITIIIIAAGFLILYLLFSWKWAVLVSLVIGLAGFISPFLRKKIEWAWMKLGHIMGFVTNNILLCIVFFLFLFPISLIWKLFNRDTLMLSKKYKSYFNDVERKFNKESFEKTW